MTKYIMALAAVLLLAGCTAADTPGGSRVQMYGQIGVGAQHTFK